MERHRLFEGPRKPEPTDAQKTLGKKREELARALKRLRAPGLRQGMARGLRKHVTILEREMVELDRSVHRAHSTIAPSEPEPREPAFAYCVASLSGRSSLREQHILVS